MKAQLLMLTTAGVLLTAGASDAAPQDVRRYLESTHAAAEARLDEAGVALESRSVAIKATVEGGGRLNGVRVVRSSGSLETDRQVIEALRKLRAPGAPAELGGRSITLTFGETAPVVQAKVP